MKYRLLIALLILQLRIYPAHIMQSTLSGALQIGMMRKIVGLEMVYIIENYDPLTAPHDISLSTQKHSVINSTSSMSIEAEPFEEKLHHPSNP